MFMTIQILNFIISLNPELWMLWTKENNISSGQITVDQKTGAVEVAMISSNISLLTPSVTLADSKSWPKQFKVTRWVYRIFLMTLQVTKLFVYPDVETIVYLTRSTPPQFSSHFYFNVHCPKDCPKEVPYSSAYFQRFWLIKRKRGRFIALII